MINIVKKELEFDDELKKKIEFICGFRNTTSTIINGNIRKIDRTNLSYIEPHRIIIKGITISVNEMNNTQKNIEYNPNVVLTALTKNGLD